MKATHPTRFNACGPGRQDRLPPGGSVVLEKAAGRAARLTMVVSGEVPVTRKLLACASVPLGNSS
jgi:hypothetical protein